MDHTMEFLNIFMHGAAVGVPTNIKNQTNGSSSPANLLHIFCSKVARNLLHNTLRICKNELDKYPMEKVLVLLQRICEFAHE